MLQVRNIAIDLDSLFDTRLGTLTVISADFAARVGGSERYYRRESDIFSTNGYRAALFGKWHLGDSWPNLPEEHGFDQI